MTKNNPQKRALALALAMALALSLVGCKKKIDAPLVDLSALAPAPAACAPEQALWPAGAVAGPAAEADTRITLNGETALVEGEGALAAPGLVTITKAGIYDIAGTFSGAIVVAVKDTLDLTDDRVTLVLNGVEITNPDGPAIQVDSTLRKTVVYTQAGSVNLLACGEGALSPEPASPDTAPDDGTNAAAPDAGAFPESPENALNTQILYDAALSYSGGAPVAALWSGKNLEVGGEGELYIRAGAGAGVYCGGDLRLIGGVTALAAPENGIACLGSVALAGGDTGRLYIEAGALGITARGNFEMESGSLHLASTGTGILAGESITLSGGWAALLCAGGNENNTLPKGDTLLPLGGWGLCAVGRLSAAGGSLSVNAGAGALYAGAGITLSGTALSLDCRETAIYTPATLAVSSGAVRAEALGRAVAAEKLEMTGGTVYLTARDGAGVETMAALADTAEKTGPDNSDEAAGGDADEKLKAPADITDIAVTGGSLMVWAGGSALACAGAEFTGGTAVLSCGGPALVAAKALVQGGTVLAMGASGATALESRGQTVLTAPAEVPGDSLFALEDESGHTCLVARVHKKGAGAIALSTPAMAQGSYTLTAGCVLADGQVTWNVCTGGTVSGGEKAGPFTAGPAPAAPQAGA